MFYQNTFNASIICICMQTADINVLFVHIPIFTENI